MALLICAPDRSNDALAADLQKRLPDTEIRIWPDVGDGKDITFAVLWKHPLGLIQGLPNLRAVSSLGAGIEHLIADPDITHKLPVGRLAGPKLSEDMALWLVGRVLSDWLEFERYRDDQANRYWQPKRPDPKPVIGILGMGNMGRVAAQCFHHLGFKVEGYSLSGRAVANVTMHTGSSGLKEVAQLADYLICLLPLTEKTRDILNRDLMTQMRAGSVLINVGRGAHLNEPDLIEGLALGKPSRAILDVFGQEPLPQDHVFWTHPQIVISPHCAALTDPSEAADLIAKSYAQVMDGNPPLGQVDLNLGY